jgi:microcystin-dependent protein
MATPFLAQIQIFPYNFAPKGWAFCQGQVLSITQNSALFSLLGTSFGGNGITNFALPDFRSRVPIGANDSGGPSLTQRLLGESGGEETVTLLPLQVPGHTHPANCNSNNGTSYDPAGNVWSVDAGGNNEYGSGPMAGQMSPGAIAAAGGGQPHANIQPYLVLNFCIALLGIYPTRS